MKKRAVLIVLLIFSISSIWFFISEGRRQRQSLDPLVQVGGKTVRDLTSVSTALISNPPPEFERKVGLEILKWLSDYGYILPEDTVVVWRVRKIGRKLLPFTESGGFLYSSEGEKLVKTQFRYQFLVAKMPFFNAFALPGGFIVITTGAINSVKNDDELAWLLAHELAHLDEKHYLESLRLHYLRRKNPAKKLGKEVISVLEFAHTFLKLSYSEELELEADTKALEILRRAGYDPKASLELMSRLFPASTRPAREVRNPFRIPKRLLSIGLREYFATHPHWKVRMERMRGKLK